MKKQIILKKNEEKRILSGHQWVFSNEIKEVKCNPEVGDIVELRRIDGKFLGLGFYHPNSLIAFRLLANQQEEISFEFFKRRIERAYAVRKRLYPQSETFRLVHGESDFLPGLIIDKYLDYFALQTFSYGMDKRLTLICDVLDSMFDTQGIIERNESPLRTLENLELRKGALRGNGRCVTISEYGIQYTIDLLEGQKTGFFLDQRENRKTIRRYIKDAVVLDCFCNEGGFALNAACAGARRVTGIDSSEIAIAHATQNASINKLTCMFERGDVFEKLKFFLQQKAQFDVIILDPPSFTKSKKNIATAKKGYKEINTNALKLLTSGGVLATSSCSHHIDDKLFMELIVESSKEAGRTIQLLEWRGAAPDHPVLPAMPETKYLKFGIFLVN